MKIKTNRIRLMIVAALAIEIGLCLLSNPYVNLIAFCVFGLLFCAYGGEVVANPNEGEMRALQRISGLLFGRKADENGDFEENE